MNKKRNWAIALILSATGAIFALQTVSAPISQDLPTEPGSTTPTGSRTYTFTPTYEACGYMWAYHDDPQLTAKFDEAVRVIDPSASANAQLFGEDCVYADGHSTFGAMETDFYVRFPVDDLTADEKFGNQIKQVMDLVASLSDEEIQGNKGFVEFSFIKSDEDRTVVRITVNDYPNNASDLTGLELLQMFYTPTSPPTTPGPITPTSTP